MRFDLSDEQRAIREAVHDLCASRYGIEVAQSAANGERGDPLWPELAKAGWTGLGVDEEHGGQGLGMVELSLVVEELGYALAPAAFLGNAAAGELITAAGTDAQRRELLPGIASGDARVAFGMLDARGDAIILDSDGAARFVVAAGDRAIVADPAKQRVESLPPLDLTRSLAKLVEVDGEALGAGVTAALDRVEVLVAAELVGVAQHAMELAVEHAKQRQQFGRPIGAYQAVSHRCADMLIEVESARSAVLSAAWTADHAPERLAFAASVAKALAGEGAWRVAASALQVHGGIGFTWEHPIHLFLRRAAASSRFLGSVDEHLDRAAELGGLSGAARR